MRERQRKITSGLDASRARGLKPVFRFRTRHILGGLVGLVFVLQFLSLLLNRPAHEIPVPKDQRRYTGLPTWIEDYVKWHREVRQAFPGRRLFDDPRAPNLLIRTCLGLCGGLNDRLGQLPWDLYLANQTGRVLLLHWHRPVPLEYFLKPNGLDWTVPKDVKGFFSADDVRVSRQDMKIVRAYTELFEGYSSENPEDDFWREHVDLALARATTGAFKDEKVLRHRLLGHVGERHLEERLKSLGESDMIHWTPSFSRIFQLFFRPSRAVQAEIDDITDQLHLSPLRYSAVHCRVRHPKAYPANSVVKGKFDEFPADKTGLPWNGKTREQAIETATKALTCAQTVLATPDEPVYFYSDSNDLVRYMSQELKDEKFVSGNRSLFEQSRIESEALDVAKRTNIVARDSRLENAHIDKQKGREPAAYFGTFLDLYLAVNARCVTFGVGFYAVLATKISGTTCRVLYQRETWGSLVEKGLNAQQCSL